MRDWIAISLCLGVISFVPAYSARCAHAAEYLVYVTNEDSNDLSIIDPDRNAVIATIPVGKRPRGVRVSPDGKHVFTALSGSPKCPPSMPDAECRRLAADKTADGIALIDAARRTLRRVLPGGSDPEQFDLSPDQTRLFVSNEDAHTASIVDIPTGAVVRTIAVGREPEGVKSAPDGRVFLVTGETDHDVTVVDANSGAVLTRVEVGLRPRDVIFRPDGGEAYVSCELSREIAVIDTATWRVTRRIELPEGSLPMGLAVTADARTLFVANGRGRTVARIDLETSQVTGAVETGVRPWGIALAPDGRRLYTANGPSNDVTVLDAETLAIIARVPVGASPWGVAAGVRP
jgi:YVTN family beta-propeller protein